MSKSTRKYPAVKDALRARDLEPALQLIAALHSQDALRELREQKVLLAATTQEDRATLVSAFKDVLEARFATADDCGEWLNYADFVLCLAGLLDEITVETRRLTHQASVFRLPELLRKLDELALEGYAAKFATDFKQMSSVLRSIQSRHRALDASEHLLQESVGTTNDLTFAIARSAVHLLQHHRQGFILSGDPGSSREVLLALVLQASRWNALEFMGDKVSYGEWSVRQVGQGEQPAVVFDIVDPRLARAMLLGLRRNVVDRRFMGKKLGPVARMLRESMREIFCGAVRFYAGLDELALLPTSTSMEIDSGVDELLVDVGVDDELLLAATVDDSRVIAAYLAELTLRCVLQAQRIASRVNQIGGRERGGCELPAELIESLHLNDEALDAHYQDALSRILHAPRPRGWVALVDRPFVTVQDRSIGFRSLLLTTWTAALRSEWGLGGAPGKRYGALWEDYVKELFETHGWECVGRGVKPRRANNEILTDADVIVIKGDLCLVVQVKGITRSGFNTYENWKARKAIEKGARQAVASVKRLREDIVLRTSVLGGERVRRVREIHGLVVTNSIAFSGWRRAGVPILSIGSLLSILRGAGVTITSIEGRSTETEIALPRRDLQTPEILEYLDAPVEWGIASDTEIVDHEWRSDFRVRFALPSLRRVPADA